MGLAPILAFKLPAFLSSFTRQWFTVSLSTRSKYERAQATVRLQSAYQILCFVKYATSVDSPNLCHAWILTSKVLAT